MNETVTLPLGNGDSLTLRTRIDGATKEALVDIIANGVFSEKGYAPSRKTPLLWIAFIQGFVIDEADVKALMTIDDEGMIDDPYVVYAAVKELRIPERLKKHKMIGSTLDEISIAADLKIKYLMDRSHADLAGGGNNVAVKTVEELSDFMRKCRQMMDMFGDATHIPHQDFSDKVEHADDAAESIIDTIKPFGIQSENTMAIIDKINEVANHSPITANELEMALQDSAASLAAANNTLDESIAMIVAANDIVQDPQRVGKLWRTVATRIQAGNNDSEGTESDIDNAPECNVNLREQILSLTSVSGAGGVDILADDGIPKSTYDIILEISKVWDSMSDMNRVALLELLAGKRYSNTLAVAIANMRNLNNEQ